MEANRRAALKSMLDSFAFKQQVENRERDDRRIALEQFLAGYAAATRDIIRPCFEEFTAELAARGHPCTIDIDQPADPSDSASAAKISLTIFPNAVTLAHGNPANSYKASPNQRKVTSSRSTMTSSGGIVASVIGEYALEELTREVIEQHLFDLASATFSPQ